MVLRNQAKNNIAVKDIEFPRPSRERRIEPLPVSVSSPRSGPGPTELFEEDHTPHGAQVIPCGRVASRINP